jgi:hypothetical protein
MMTQQMRGRWIAAGLAAVVVGGVAWQAATAAADPEGAASEVNLGTGTGLRKDCDPSLPPNVHVMWRFQPRSLNGLRTRASTIVLAQVRSVRQAPDTVVAVPRMPGGEVRTPNQVVAMTVRKSYKGSLRPGQGFALIKMGSGCFRVADDPAYREGETHLLMLEAAAAGQLRAVAPQGRYRQRADGTLHAVTQDPVTASVENRRPEAVLQTR